MHPLSITRLAVRDVRNLESVDVEPAPRFNVIHGDNGQGKTNLIEALYVACTSKSFRATKTVEVVRQKSENASVRLTIDEDGAKREQSVGLESRGHRHLRIDGARPKTSALYASKTPVVVFSPASLTLTMGSSKERRTLLDRVALYVDPASLVEVASYQRAVRERQRALEERGVHARDLDEWEELVVRHGVNVMNAREGASVSVLEAAGDAFRRIAAEGLAFEGRYAPSAPREAEAYRTELAQSRPRDVRRGSASIGPHRDDLVLDLATMPARLTASQGQHRALVLSLKAAELDVIGRARGVRPILLLDDVSSELDADRTNALFSFLASQSGQVFLTTTRPELIPFELEGRLDFRIVAGRLTR